MQKTINWITVFSISILFMGCNNSNDNYSIEESGIIETENIILSSKTQGEVLKLLKDEGDFLNAGDTLLIIDQEKLELQLRQTLAAERAANAQLKLLISGAREEDIVQAMELVKQAEANFNLAENDKNRMEKLYSEQAVTKKQFEDASTRFNIALAQYNSAKANYNKVKNITRKEEIDQAEANLQKATATVDLINKSIRDCFLITPIDGQVVKKFVEIGESVIPQSNLIKISNLSNVELTIYVSEENLGKIKLRQSVDVTVDSYKDRTYKGKVTYISPEAEFTPKNIQTKDERTKLVFAVKIKISNPNYDLKAGMPADAVVYIN
ncbi:HlyD family secretion protein [Bacteroidota bacterium]